MNYTFYKKQILRTPLKPLKISFTKAELAQLFTQKEVKEALFLSSPNLLNELTKWQKGDLINSKEEQSLLISLLKYAVRMHSRCTPFGLFAGCSVVNSFMDTYRIPILNETLVSRGVRSTRLDMNFTCALAQELAKFPFIKKSLKFYPNTSIYKLQDKLRYIEYKYKEKKRIHQITAVDNSIYIEKIIQKAKNGATIDKLAEIIIEEDINREDASEFVNELITAQLLVSELEPSVIGDELLVQILTRISTLELELKGKISPKDEVGLRQVISTLQNIQVQLIKLDEKIGNDITTYRVLATNLKKLNIPFELSKLFQTDLYKNEHKEIQDNGKNINKTSEKSSISEDLNEVIAILNKLTLQPDTTNLTEFQKNFYQRYENKEVPLLEALDIESGIGYAQNTNHTGDVNPLLNGLRLPYSIKQKRQINWSTKDSFLLGKILKAQKNKEKVVQLSDNDVKQFKTNWNDLPNSFSVMYKHLGKRQGKDLISISHIGGSSATSLLGRFASSNFEMEAIVKDIAEKEQNDNPNVIYAEIAHLPENRTGNVLLRPVFRKYEIPYLSNSSLPKEQQITLDDLYISVKKNQLFLYSKRLNSQVIPRLGNAHNFSFKSLPVYQFLCDLQTQKKRNSLSFNWGNLASEFSFLPRVEIGNVIVFSATWQFKKVQYDLLLKKKDNLHESILKWKQKWRLPNLILLVEGDNELLINLKDQLSVKMFVSIIKKRPNIILKEFIFDKKSVIVKDEKRNAYTNEFITIIQKKKDASLTLEKSKLKQSKTKGRVASLPLVSAQGDNEISKKKTRRIFTLGSEWLFYKIYSGVKTGDTILTKIVKPLSEKLLKLQLIDSWFFIRYYDPETHLRVRFHFTNLNHIGTVISLFHSAIAEYEQSGLIWKVQTDSYKREIERYGESSIRLGEQLFHFDSKCIVDMLDMIDGDKREEVRWLFAFKAVDQLLSDFNYSADQKMGLLETLKNHFALEFNMNKNLKIQLDKKFRIHRKSISDILDFSNDKRINFHSLFELLDEKSNKIKQIVNQIIELHQNNELSLPLNDLLASYIHMLLNRLFKNKQRLHELVVYDFMWRSYRSEIAKQKHIKKQKAN